MSTHGYNAFMCIFTFQYLTTYFYIYFTSSCVLLSRLQIFFYIFSIYCLITEYNFRRRCLSLAYFKCIYKIDFTNMLLEQHESFKFVCKIYIQKQINVSKQYIRHISWKIEQNIDAMENNRVKLQRGLMKLWM